MPSGIKKNNRWHTSARNNLNNYIVCGGLSLYELQRTSVPELIKKTGCGRTFLYDQHGEYLEAWKRYAETTIASKYETTTRRNPFERRYQCFRHYLEDDPVYFFCIYQHDAIDFTKTVIGIFEPLIDYNSLHKWQCEIHYVLWLSVRRFLIYKGKSLAELTSKEKAEYATYFQKYLYESFLAKCDKYHKPGTPGFL